MDEDDDDLMTPEQMASVLKVTSRTILYWEGEGRIPAEFRSGRVVRFRKREVLRALKEGTREPRSVQLASLAVYIALKREFPCLVPMDVGTLTEAEEVEIKRQVRAYLPEIEALESPQERAAYADGVVKAAIANVR